MLDKYGFDMDRENGITMADVAELICSECECVFIAGREGEFCPDNDGGILYRIEQE